MLNNAHGVTDYWKGKHAKWKPKKFTLLVIRVPHSIQHIFNEMISHPALNVLFLLLPALHSALFGNILKHSSSKLMNCWWKFWFIYLRYSLIHLNDVMSRKELCRTAHFSTFYFFTPKMNFIKQMTAVLKNAKCNKFNQFLYVCVWIRLLFV